MLRGGQISDLRMKIQPGRYNLSRLCSRQVFSAVYSKPVFAERNVSRSVAVCGL